MRRAAKTQMPDKPVTLKMLAAHLKLDPATVSVVLNDVPGRSIPDNTRARIKAAARTLGYSPNVLARSLRTSKTRTIGILLPDMADAYYSQIVSGISMHLAQVDYCCMTLPHGYDASRVPLHLSGLMKRGVEGLIMIDTALEQAPPLPTVAVGSTGHAAETTVIELDHGRAAALALQCILRSGHRELLLIGHGGCDVHASKLSNAVRQVAASFGLEVRIGRTAMIGGRRRIIDDSDRPSSLDKVKAVVALGADAATIALRSLHAGGVSRLEDLSIVCIDTEGKSIADSAITVIRQPLRNLGQLAAGIILQKLSAERAVPRFIAVEPEVVAKTALMP